MKIIWSRNKHELHDSVEQYEEQPEYQLDMDRKVSRHRRIKTNEIDHHTMMRNMSHPEIIAEYDITERVPIDNIQSGKNHDVIQFSYHKYADKYSLAKNCKKMFPIVKFSATDNEEK
jgi:hypothetical protein